MTTIIRKKFSQLLLFVGRGGGGLCGMKRSGVRVIRKFSSHIYTAIVCALHVKLLEKAFHNHVVYSFSHLLLLTASYTT